MRTIEDYIYEGMKKAGVYDIKDVAFWSDKNGVVVRIMSRNECYKKIEDENN